MTKRAAGNLRKRIRARVRARAVVVIHITVQSVAVVVSEQSKVDTDEKPIDDTERARQLDMPLSEWLKHPIVLENDASDAATCLKVLKKRGITTVRQLLFHPKEGSVLLRWPEVKERCAKLFNSFDPDDTVPDPLVVDDMSRAVGYGYIAEAGTRNRLVGAIKLFFGQNPFYAFAPG
jgi:hypothetical protein